MTPRVLPESAVLQPHDPTLANSDDWAIFELIDAVVTDPNEESQPPTTLLHASAYYPLTVTGRLRPLPKKQAHLYLPQSHRSSPVEITDVRLFSYGAYEDGSIGLWAGGKAGWFHIISPSPAYRQVYDSMAEAVKLLHFLADTYATPRVRTGNRGQSTTTLPDYSAHEAFELYASHVGLATAAEAAERVHAHRIFLLSSMIAGKEGLAWGKNPVYVHLRQKFPSDRERVRGMLMGPEGRQRAAMGDSATRERAGSTGASSTTSSLKRKRGRPPKDGPSDVISIASSSVASSTAKGRTKELSAAVASKDSPQPASLRSSTSRQTRTRNGSQSVPIPGTPEIQQPKQEDEDEDSETDSVSQPRKGKSALRLKSNVSSKGPPARSKPAFEEDEDPDDIDRKPALQPTSRISTAHQPLKTDLDEGISMPTSPSSSSQPDPDTLPGGPSSPLPLRFNHTRDPVQEDTWRCALAGCTHKVYSASSPSAQTLIREHYALHAYDDDARVGLVKTLAQPSLPAGRLMEKVKMQAKAEGFPASRVAGTRFPEPLERRL